MGQYRIVIEGTGCHHNGDRQPPIVDADREAQALTDKLRENGHSVTAARFELVSYQGVAYSTDNLLDGSKVQGTYIAPEPTTISPKG